MRIQDAKPALTQSQKENLVTRRLFLSRLRIGNRVCIAAVFAACVGSAGQGSWAQVAQLQFTPAQLNVVAGTGAGTVNGTGDGGSALSATFDSPASVAQDAAGNIYVVDSAANYVRKFDVNGNITAFAGVPGYGPGSFSGDNGQATAAHLSMMSTAISRRSPASPDTVQAALAETTGKQQRLT
jgi:hypothetical protein